MVNLVCSEINTFLNKRALRSLKNLTLSSFEIIQLSHTYVQRHEDEEETRNEDDSSQSSLPILTETDSESDDYNNAPLGAPTRTLIPLPPLVSSDNTNLPFMQTFVANIFIF